MREISIKYKLRHDRQLSDWIKVHHAHGDFNSISIFWSRKSHEARMGELEEQIQMVKECPAGGKNYGEMALKYQVSCQQIRTRTLRFEEMGEGGLEDQSGKRKRIKDPGPGWNRQAKNLQYIAENLLGRQFHGEKPNEKWLTDVTGFKWYEGVTVHKLYLSAILDLCGRRIVSHVLSERNDNPLACKIFDKVMKGNPDVHPLFHSGRNSETRT